MNAGWHARWPACRRARLPIAAASLSLVLAAASWPALAADEPGEQQQQEKLYLEGLQAISEGRKNDASELFQRLIKREPQHAGAYLEIALIQCELGHADYAESLFKEIERRFSPSPAILELMNQARAKGCAQWLPHVQWSLMAGRGYDQNVNQGASNPNFSFGHGEALVNVELAPEYLPLADHYSIVSADYQRELSQNGMSGFVQLQGRNNDFLTKYNTISIFAGIEQAWRIGDWPLRGSVMAGLLSLGGALYQKQGVLQLRATPPLPLPASLQANLTAALTHMQYQRLDGFDSNTLDLRGQLSYQTQTSQTTGSIGIAADRALGARPGGDRRGWLASLQTRAQLSRQLIGELALTHQAWRSTRAYSPGLIDDRRQQATTMLRCGLIVPLGRDQALHVEWRTVRNQENIAIFQYKSRQIQVTWQWQK